MIRPTTRKPRRTGPAVNAIESARAGAAILAAARGLAAPGAIVVVVPAATVSEPNKRGTWHTKARRVKEHRRVAGLMVRAALSRVGATPGRGFDAAHYLVRLSRFAPGELDDDNLRGALKAVRDGVADALDLDDRSPRITWHYDQARLRAGVYLVLVELLPLRVWTGSPPPPSMLVRSLEA